MKRAVWVCTLVSIIGVGADWISGQGRGNPFADRSDTGEIVHVLPPPAAIHSPRDTQPTNAPVRDRLAVYPASYGSGNLIDHGGGTMLFAGYYAIYYNSAVATSAGSQGHSTLQEQVQAFVNAFAPTGTASYSQTDQNANYSIISQYGSISPTLFWGGDYVDNQPSGGSLSDSKVRSYLANLLAANKVPLNENNIYGIYFPAGMKITLQGGASCSSFCGYHGHFSYNGKDIKYAVYPYTDCVACSLPGKAVADMLTIVTSHEIREAATDPDLNAWFDSVGYEADDKCAWHNLYQTATGSFWVQPEYSNGTSSQYPGPGCVVPLGGGGSVKTDTSTTLGSSGSPSTFGSPVTFTATVTPASGPSGTVTFFDGGATLGTGTLNGSGQAQLSTSTLSGGAHTITAVYGGNASYNGSTSVAFTQEVTGAPTTTALEAIPNPSVFGDMVTFTATVTQEGTSTVAQGGTVTFLDDTTPIGTLPLDGTGHATLLLSALTVDTHQITAQYSGDGYYFNGSTSSVVSQVVKAAPVGSFSLSAAPSSVSVSRSGTAPVSITVTPNDGFTGSVALSVSGVPPQSTATFSPDTVTVSGGSASSALTIAIGRRTPLKTYTVTIIGTSGSQSATTTIALTVQ